MSTADTPVAPGVAPVERSGPLAILRIRAYRYLVLGTLFSQLANWIQNLGQGWLVYQLTGSAFQLSLVAFCQGAGMFIMSPIGGVEELDSDLLHVLLQANYDRALDARYAMRGNELWSVVVHPLATLATDDLPSLFDQVALLVKNTGSTYASTELVFRSFPGDDIVIETEDDPGDDPEDAEVENGGDDEDDEDEGESSGR